MLPLSKLHTSILFIAFSAQVAEATEVQAFLQALRSEAFFPETYPPCRKSPYTF